MEPHISFHASLVELAPLRRMWLPLPIRPSLRQIPSITHLPLTLGTDQLTSLNLRATQFPEMLKWRGASVTSHWFLSFIQTRGTPAPALCQPFRALSRDHCLVVLFSGNSSGRQWGNTEQWTHSTFWCWEILSPGENSSLGVRWGRGERKKKEANCSTSYWVGGNYFGPWQRLTNLYHTSSSWVFPFAADSGYFFKGPSPDLFCASPGCLLSKLASSQQR